MCIPFYVIFKKVGTFSWKRSVGNVSIDGGKLCFEENW